MSSLKLCFMLAFGAALLSCTPKMESTKAAQPTLSQKEATSRFEQVSNVTYDQEFWLDASKETFTGKIDIAFDWKVTTLPVKIDFFRGEIKKATVNSQDVTLKYDDRQITIDNKFHVNGRQHVILEFARVYDPEANGLFRFVDPVDKKLYLYSNLEPNFASAVFPCFDQPDIKATFKMTVHAPDNWTIVTSTLPEKVSEPEDGVKTWTFPLSAKMATYVWSLHGGEYKIFEDKKADFPTRIFIRQSLADQIRPEEWFPPAKAGLKFYGEFFGITYPYKKLDLVLVPEFNWGGMENIAAITLTESEVKKGAHTREQKLKIAGLLLHEIAHQWFGDLVTMKWWDDLWLNESFATFMESLSLPKAGFQAEAARDFFHDKLWAYATDDRVTTHPIAGVITDTSQAESQFDGITYGKGASVMKQLMYLITEEKFRDGVREHFKAHRDSFAVLADFMGALGKASGRSLDTWTQQWLKTSGLNTAVMDVTCTNGKITSAKIKQYASKDHPVLREQAMKIAFLSGEGKLEVKDMFRVQFSGDVTELKEITGRKCPKMIFPNYQDYGYAKFRLDDASLATLKTSIGLIKDPFVREMAWMNLFSLVIDGEWSIKEFAALWLQEFPKETDDRVLTELSGLARARYAFMPSILSFSPPGKDLETWRAKVDEMLWAELDKSKGGSDRQMILMDSILSLASTTASQKKLAGMLDGTVTIAGFDFDQTRRWQALRRLATANIPDLGSRIDAELKRDSSADGEQRAIAARVSVPEKTVKDEFLKTIADDKSPMSFTKKKVAISNLFPEEQIDLRNEFGEMFYKDLTRFVGKETRSDFFLESFVRLAPLRAGKNLDAETFLSRHNVLPETVRRFLKEHVETGERLQKAHSTALAKATDVPPSH
jgi:aminopeptidase N